MSTDPPTFASNHLVETEYEALNVDATQAGNNFVTQVLGHRVVYT
ncbi:7848_t:CDS:2 [Entrophospora sp. SA101]|nr:7848_t:CDS:2 [Entrophospora sp. SA101]